MKLKKLSLNNFGRFRGEVLKLEDGINVIYGENESGKSTVHTFIRSMLFGMKRGRGRAAGNDVYSRYEPWENASWYQGRMEFTSGGKEFRLTGEQRRQPECGGGAYLTEKEEERTGAGSGAAAKGRGGREKPDVQPPFLSGTGLQGSERKAGADDDRTEERNVRK